MSLEDIRGFAAGWFGGGAGLIASHPMDTVRIRIQTQESSIAGKRYSTAIQCFWDIYKTEKVRGLFKGMTYPLLGQAMINSVVFGTQRIAMKWLPKAEPNSNLGIRNETIAGMFAGGVQSIIVCPMELIKIQMQNQGIGKEHVSWLMKKGLHMNGSKISPGSVLEKYHGPLETTLQIAREQGLKGLYRGWWLTLFREIPQFGIYFGTFAFTQRAIARYANKTPEELGVFWLALAGGVTGVVTWCWYPVDVIKSRFQDNRANSKAVQYKGIIDCVVKSYQAEGLKVFVRGLQPTLMRGFANGFVTLPVVTILERLWKR